MTTTDSMRLTSPPPHPAATGLLLAAFRVLAGRDFGTRAATRRPASHVPGNDRAVPSNGRPAAPTAHVLFQPSPCASKCRRSLPRLLSFRLHPRILQTLVALLY